MARTLLLAALSLIISCFVSVANAGTGFTTTTITTWPRPDPLLNETPYQYWPKIASNGSEFLLAWYEDYYTGYPEYEDGTPVYAARFSETGEILDPDGILIDPDISPYNSEQAPAVCAVGDDYWVLYHGFEILESIWGTRVNADGTVGQTLVIGNGVGLATITKMAAASNDQGNFIAVWLNAGDQPPSIGYSVHTSTGEYVVEGFLPFEPYVFDADMSLSVAASGSTFLVTYGDQAIRVDGNGNVLDTIPIDLARGYRYDIIGQSEGWLAISQYLGQETACWDVSLGGTRSYMPLAMGLDAWACVQPTDYGFAIAASPTWDDVFSPQYGEVYATDSDFQILSHDTIPNVDTGSQLCLATNDAGTTVAVWSHGWYEDVFGHFDFRELRGGVYAPGPTINCSTESLHFVATQNTGDPLAQGFTVSSSSTSGTLNWSVVFDAEWLTVTPTTGSSAGEENSITASVSILGLSPGTYDATITITDPAVNNSPQVIPVTLDLYPPTCSLPFQDDFNADRGWSGYVSGGWERGPAVDGGWDPGVDYSPGDDNSVLGYNIGGPYSQGMPGRGERVISPPLDCSGGGRITLTLWRWLSVDDLRTAKAAIFVSNDGVHWVYVWNNVPQAPTLDSAWTKCEYEITEQASGHPMVLIGVAMGPTDEACTVYGGWNIDDVSVESNSLVAADAGPDKIIEASQSTTLEGSASGGVAPYSYDWSPRWDLSDWSVAQPTASPWYTQTYTLTVTDALGYTSTDAVTVYVAPPLVAEAGPDKVILAGESTRLYGNATGGRPGYTESWTPTTGLSDPNIFQPDASPASTTTYTLTVTDSLSQTDTDTVTVTVASGVVANAGPDKLIGAGGFTTLEGSASGGAGPYSYTWYGPISSLNDRYAARPIASPATTSTYTLIVRDSLAQTDNDAVTVTVASAVVANAGPDRTIAAGGSAMLEGSASGGVGPYAYSWSPTAGLSSTSVAQPTASPASTITYTLTLTDNLGQTDTDTVTVTVASAVVAEAGPTKLIGPGGSATLDGSASGGVPPYTYSWSPTTGLSNPNIAQPTASPSVTMTYTLTVSDDLGQTDTDTVTVTLTTAATAEAGPNKTIATGGSAMLEGSASGGVAPYTYSWSPSSGLSSTSVAQPTASPESTTTYTLTVTDSLAQTSMDTVTVTVASPVVANAGPDKLIGAGGSSTLDGSASGGVAPYSYSWSPPTGLDDPHVAQPTASPSVTTTYTLTVSDNLGQIGTDSATVTLTADVVAEAGPNKTIAAGGSAMLAGSASGGVGPYAYSWSPTAGLSSTSVAQPTASPGSTTVYTLSVTDDLGQTDTDSVTVTVLLSVFPDVPSDHWAFGAIVGCVNAGIVSGYDDGLYHGDWPVTRDQMAVYISRALAGGDESVPDFTGTPTFPDVDAEHWALRYVEYAVDQSVIGGYDDGTYHPEYEVTRDQMAVYVARSICDPTGEDGLTGYVPAAPRDFPDVPNTGYGDDGTEPFWAYLHVEYCVEDGVVQGYDDGLYHPDWVVTRDQMAMYVARAFGLL